VLAEEYRLLRMQRSAASPPSAAPVRRQPPPPGTGSERFAAQRPGWWAWVKRVSQRAVEGS
jgi:hypothetical protein